MFFFRSDLILRINALYLLFLCLLVFMHPEEKKKRAKKVVYQCSDSQLVHIMRTKFTQCLLKLVPLRFRRQVMRSIYAFACISSRFVKNSCCYIAKESLTWSKEVGLECIYLYF